MWESESERGWEGEREKVGECLTVVVGVLPGNTFDDTFREGQNSVKWTKREKKPKNNAALLELLLHIRLREPRREKSRENWCRRNCCCCLSLSLSLSTVGPKQRHQAKVVLRRWQSEVSWRCATALLQLLQRLLLLLALSFPSTSAGHFYYCALLLCGKNGGKGERRWRYRRWMSLGGSVCLADKRLPIWPSVNWH